MSYFENYEMYFDNNMIYCEDTHSFVHRLFDKIKKGLEDKEYNYKSAQNDAFTILGEMEKEYKEEMHLLARNEVAKW